MRAIYTDLWFPILWGLIMALFMVVGMTKVTTRVERAVALTSCEGLPTVDMRAWNEDVTAFEIREVLDAVGAEFGGCAAVDNGDGSFSWRND